MAGNRTFSLVMFFAMALLFSCGVGELLIMRFETGDVYPSYSSYRQDPQGTRALMEGLGLVRGVRTDRNTVDLAKLAGIEDATVFLVGFDEKAFSRVALPSVEALEDGARKGARIVIAFGPLQREGQAGRPVPTKETGKRKEGGEDEEAPGGEPVDLYARWQVGTRFVTEARGQAGLEGGVQGLPSSVDWHSALVFEPHSGDWRTVYEREGSPVLMERTLGKGEIVLASDSYFFSNEAMKGDRRPDLLSWLCGAHHRIIFDETHLGISESPGIVRFIEKHGLTPFFISLIVLILLALWRAHAAFVPVPKEREGIAAAVGKDYSTGLVNLLRRNIPPEDALALCVDEWEGSFAHAPRDRSVLVTKMKEIAQEDLAKPRRMRNPVDAYRRIGRLVARRVSTRIGPMSPIGPMGKDGKAGDRQ